MAAKNADDFAVLAGINRYPRLGDLNGPENDAIAFRDWLLAPEGGSLEERNITLIRSSDFAAGGDMLLAKPSAQEILLPLRRLREQGMGNGWHLGRRLYLFFAGHGFAPTSVQSDMSDPVLLTADAAQTELLHVPVVKYANWFRDSGMFDEVVLFMDCCRRGNVSVGPQAIPWSRTNDRKASRRTFYALAARLGVESREREFEGVRHGVFTKTLLNGLLGAAAPKDGGRITGTLLAEFLHRQVPLASGSGQSDVTRDEELDPEIRFDPSFDLDFGQPPSSRVSTTPVCIKLADDTVGSRVKLLDSTRRIVAVRDSAPALWLLDLLPGFYKLEGPTRSILFEVTTPNGEVLNVSF
ncbi:MAG: hypothetical protein U1A78_25045 [Polyangia bacterium]